MRRFFRCTAVLVLMALLLMLCGCSSSGGIDQYFSLPQPTEEYLQLQQLIDQEIAARLEAIDMDVAFDRPEIREFYVKIHEIFSFWLED